MILDDTSRVVTFERGWAWRWCYRCNCRNNAFSGPCPWCGGSLEGDSVGTVSKVDVAAGSYTVDSGDPKPQAHDGYRNRAERRAARRRR